MVTLALARLGLLLTTTLLSIDSKSFGGDGGQIGTDTEKSLALGYERQTSVDFESNLGGIDGFTLRLQQDHLLLSREEGGNSKRRRSSRVRKSPFFSEVLDKVGEVASDVGEAIAGAFNTVKDTIVDTVVREWEKFKSNFSKSYSSDEEEKKSLKTFEKNRENINKFNEEFAEGQHTFEQELNEYADLSNSTFQTMVNGFQINTDRSPTMRNKSPIGFTLPVPPSKDWTKLGAVTSVRHQGKCSGCYAFSAVGALEAVIFKTLRKLVQLSVQHLLDCTRSYGNDGCIGGHMTSAFEYVMDHGRIAAESVYPFEDFLQVQKHQCRDDRKENLALPSNVTLLGYQVIDEGDEEELERAVAFHGPVSAAIDASLDSFRFYMNGIYYDPECKSDIESLNHGVLVVGYGEERTGGKYWLIKNSYGERWGLDGYMKLAKFRNNHCGIATHASYPFV